MKKIPSSIALRLTIWFLVLSFLPLGVMAFFVSRNVMKAFEQQAVVAQREQARLNAEHFVDYADDKTEIMAHLLHSQPRAGEHFIADTRGLILFHLDKERVGQSLQDVYGPQTAMLILSTRTGGMIDSDAGYIIGFSRFPDGDWIDVVTVEISALEGVIVDLRWVLLVLLGVSLLVVSLACGLAVWFVLAKPLRRLTQAARELGRENLAVELDTSGMNDELSLLAVTINETQREIGSLVGGLQQKVIELDRAYLSLRESEERSRLIFDSMNDAILLQDIESGEIQDVNKRFLEMSGYERDDLSTLRVSDLSSGVNGYSFRNLLRIIRQARKGEPQLFEWYARRKDGSCFWVEINARIVNLDADKRRLVIVVRDIDQRKRNQQVQVAMYRIVQLGQAKPSLYEFFSSVHQILQTVFPCPNLIVALYNDNQQKAYYPYRLDEREIWPLAKNQIDDLLLQAMQNADGVLWVNSDNLKDYMSDGWSLDDFDFSNQDWIGIPLQTSRRLQGVLVMKYYGTSPRPAHADLEFLSLVCVQVAAALERQLAENALRESEARWQTLMKSSPQLIITVNRAGEILFVNQSLSELLGDAHPDGAFLYFLPGEDNDEKMKTLNRVFNQRTPISFEFSIKNSGVNPTWFSANLAPVVDGGRVDLAIFNAMDITVRKNAEDQAIRLNDQLEERVRERTSMLEAANRELESFSYSVSHDLRAPLRAINGFSRILQDEFLDSASEAHQRYLNLIRENAKQMGLLIDDLLSLSRFGRQKLNMQVVPMLEIVEQALSTLAPEVEGRKFHVVLPVGLPNCFGDPVLIKQVWINLLSNAFKFARLREEAQVEIGFEERKDDIIYSIRDNGTGFDMKYADKLFGVFQRLHRSEDFEGTGVGLAIVHRIINRHGGQIWAQSELEQGAAFFFSLPSKSKKIAKK